MTTADEILYAPIYPELKVVGYKANVEVDCTTFYAPYVPLTRWSTDQSNPWVSYGVDADPEWLNYRTNAVYNEPQYVDYESLMKDLIKKYEEIDQRYYSKSSVWQEMTT